MTPVLPPAEVAIRPHPRTITWRGATALALGGSNQSIFLIGALLATQGSFAIILLALGLVLAYMATPGWIELSCMFPNRVGGIAATCAEAFRPYGAVLSNLTGVCYWWGWVPTCGLTAIFSADAIHQWYLPSVPVKLLATILVLLFMGVNLCGLKWAVRLAVPIACAAGLLALGTSLIPIFAGTVNWHQAASFHLVTPFAGAFGKLTSAMAGLYLVGFAAPAFEAAACHIGEMKDPARDQPRAMWTSGVVAIVYFVIMPMVWLGLFGSAKLQGDLASLVGPSFAPLVGSLGKAAGIWFIALNMFSGTIQPLSGSARTLSQLSEDGLLPRTIGYRHPRTDAPVVAIGVTAAFSIVFLLAGDPTSLIAAANLTYLIGIGSPSFAVWLLRRHEPDRPRPYRAGLWSLRLGVVAAAVWTASTVLGFEQFGIPTVLFGLVLAFSGSLAYIWRVYFDHRGAGTSIPRRSLHIKLTGALMVVFALNGVGYVIAINSLSSSDVALISLLKDIFVAVGLLTISVGLILPGVIAHNADKIASAATTLSRDTLADLSRAMEAFSSGQLEAASFHFSVTPLEIRSRDEFGEMALSFNAMQESVSRVHSSLATAVADALAQRNSLEETVKQRTGELREAYDRLKYSQAQRYDILSRIKVYTDLMEDRTGDPGDIVTLNRDIVAALGPVMSADVAVVQLAEDDASASVHALAWCSAKLNPRGDGESVREMELSPQLLALEREAVVARMTRSINEPSGDLVHLMWGEESESPHGFSLLVTPFFSNEGGLIGLIILGREGTDTHWGDTSIVDFVAADLGRGVMSARLFQGQQRLVHQLQDLDRTRDEMLSTFSHELRTPLASIVAYAELLNDDPLMTSHDKHMIAIIERNAHRLSRLVEDILSLSNFSAELMGSELDVVNIDPIVRSTYDAIAPTIDRNLHFAIETNASDALIMADTAQIERLCFNLLTNAIKFTPDDGTVIITTRREDDDVVLGVADTGIGIDPDEIDHIYDRFYRGDNAIDDVIPGTGLGLAIVDVIVRHHGGTISVSSNIPCGTVFEVRLPTVRARRENAAVADAADTRPHA